MRNVLLFGFLLALCTSSYAQRFELNAWAGFSSYQGDINKNQFILANELDATWGVGAKVNLSSTIGISAHYSKGQISGTDQNFDDRQFWENNLNFVSDYHDFLVNVEWKLIKPKGLKLYDRDGDLYMPEDENDKTPVYDFNGNQVSYQDGYYVAQADDKTYVYNEAGEYTTFDQDGLIMETHYPKHFTPYVFIGIGASYFDPKVDGLPSDANEAMADAYSNIHLTVPFGMGFRYDFSRRFAVAVDGAFKYGFSDYLDGVSESRNAEKNDWYVASGVRFIYKIGSKRDFVM